MNHKNSVILFIACSAVFLEALDLAIMNLALPLIQKDFNLQEEQSQWLQTIYVLIYGGFLIIGGKLADIWGRKKVFLTGAILFLMTSIFAGNAASFESLFLCRAIQGLGAALLMPSAMAIITNTFTEDAARSKALGIFSSFAAIGSGCGLSLGGIIASSLGWHWIFFINIPIISTSLLFAFLLLKPDSRPANRMRPDLLSGVLLSACILLLSYFIHALPVLLQQPVQLSLFLLLISSGFFYFFNRTKRHTSPLIDFALLKTSSAQIGNKTIFILGTFFLSYLLILSFYLQEVLDFSAARAGLLLFPFSVASALISRFLLPRLIKRLKLIRTANLGMSLMFLGAFLLVISMSYGLFVPLVFSIACVTGAGMAISIPSLTVMALHQVPIEHQGVASGINTTAYFFGSGIGLSAVSLIMQLTTIFPTTTKQLIASTTLLLLLTAFAALYLFKKASKLKRHYFVAFMLMATLSIQQFASL